MGQTNPKVILIVVVAIALLAFIGVGSIALSLFLHTYADPSILTALIAITSGLVGSLTTILSSPRGMPPSGDTTTTTNTTTTTKPTPAAPAAPAEVKVVNTTEDPVPTDPQP